jgi:predicted nucleic acid-binding protein
MPLFKHMSAIRRNVWFEDGHQASYAAKDNQGLQVQLFAVPIDQAFIERYPMVGLPNMKAGDLLYLAMAKADGAHLITEDQELYDKARGAGVTAFKVFEYVSIDNLETS